MPAVPIPGQPNAAPPPPWVDPRRAASYHRGVVRQMPRGYYVATPPNLAYAPGSPGGATLGRLALAALGSPVPCPSPRPRGPCPAANQETEDERVSRLSQLVEGPVLGSRSAASTCQPKRAPMPTTPRFLPAPATVTPVKPAAKPALSAAPKVAFATVLSRPGATFAARVDSPKHRPYW